MFQQHTGNNTLNQVGNVHLTDIFIVDCSVLAPNSEHSLKCAFQVCFKSNTWFAAENQWQSSLPDFHCIVWEVTEKALNCILSTLTFYESIIFWVSWVLII